MLYCLCQQNRGLTMAINSYAYSIHSPLPITGQPSHTQNVIEQPTIDVAKRALRENPVATTKADPLKNPHITIIILPEDDEVAALPIRIKVNKDQLCRITYFKIMLEGNFRERDTEDSITLRSLNPEAEKKYFQLLRLNYSTLETADVSQLLHIADKYSDIRSILAIATLLMKKYDWSYKDSCQKIKNNPLIHQLFANAYDLLINNENIMKQIRSNKTLEEIFSITEDKLNEILQDAKYEYPPQGLRGNTIAQKLQAEFQDIRHRLFCKWNVGELHWEKEDFFFSSLGIITAGLILGCILSCTPLGLGAAVGFATAYTITLATTGAVLIIRKLIRSYLTHKLDRTIKQCERTGEAEATEEDIQLLIQILQGDKLPVSLFHEMNPSQLQLIAERYYYRNIMSSDDFPVIRQFLQAQRYNESLLNFLNSLSRDDLKTHVTRRLLYNKLLPRISDIKVRNFICAKLL